MPNLNEDKLKLLAYQLFSSHNQNAKRNLDKKKINQNLFFELSGSELKLLGFCDREIGDILHRKYEIAVAEIEKVDKNNILLAFRGDEYYPEYLTEIYDPPGLLYILGDPEVLKMEKLAVVGSRKGSSYSFLSLKKIIPPLVQSGLTIVSGMAYGVDSMAQRITIDEGGKTIGVNAGGLLRLYPAGNIGLINKIIANGCVISEFPLDQISRPYLFPIRNRIIAGVSKSVLVVEATQKSGSLITARLALEQNRDVYAVPGRIDSSLSSGTNYLIKQGAKLIETANDILVEYGMKLQRRYRPEKADISKKEQKILDFMPANELKNIDYFVEKLEFSVSEVISTLMGLVLKNLVMEEAGFYKRIE